MTDINTQNEHNTESKHEPKFITGHFLSKPEHGWTDVCVGNTVNRASYLTDVPMQCLKGIINCIDDTAAKFCDEFDAEGWNHIIISDMVETYIITITDNDYLSAYHNISVIDLAKQLIKDLEDDLEGWVNWECDNAYKTPEQIEARRKEMTDGIAKLRTLIAEYYEHVKRMSVLYEASNMPLPTPDDNTTPSN